MSKSQKLAFELLCLATSLLRLSWRAIVVLSVLTFRLLDGLILNTGKLTLFLHHHLTSMHAMRRNVRWAVASFWAVDRAVNWSGDLFAHVFILRGRLGPVYFDVEEEEKDGHVILRHYGDQINVPSNFRIENRWLIRRNIVPDSRIATQIMSQALEQGLRVSQVVWGETVMKPYDIESIGLLRRPEDDVLPKEKVWKIDTPKVMISEGFYATDYQAVIFKV